MGRECLSRLYIGHLPMNTSEDDFRSFLLSDGTLARNSFSITVKKGYAFMQCCDQATADRVIDQFNGTKYQGSTLSIEPAVSNYSGLTVKHGRCLMTITKLATGNSSDTPGSIEDLEKILATWGGNVLSMEKLASSKYVVTVEDAKAVSDLVTKCHGLVSNGLTVSAEPAPEYLKSEGAGGDDAQPRSSLNKVQQTEISSTSPNNSSGYEQKALQLRPFPPRSFYPGSNRNSGEFRRYSEPNPTFPWRMLIPSTQVGALIGRGGATIRGITQETGTRINIHTGQRTSRYRGEDLEKIVRIVGTPANCTIACRKILEVLAQDLSKSFGSELALRLVAYDSLIGRVIGKGGSTITGIMQESNTRIHISNIYETARSGYHKYYRRNDCDRIITIRGSIGGMIQAESLVSQKLRSSYENDMMHPPVVNLRQQY